MSTSTIAPGYLSTKQLKILNFLYRFRYANTDLLAQSLQITKPTAQRRLQILLERGYIGRIYEHSYRLSGKPAIYFIQTEGIQALKHVSPTKYDRRILRNMKKDATASLDFMHHWLAVFKVYCKLREQYGDELQFFTQNQLAELEHFPDPLPDAFIRLGIDKLYFLDVLNEHPFFKATRKVMQHIKFADERAGEWADSTNSSLPDILLVCENAALQKRLTKRMQRALTSQDNGIGFYAIEENSLLDGGVWQDMSDPERAVTLDDKS